MTAASIASENCESKKCFFVGRRGTGKTAISINIKRKNRRVIDIIPQVFDLLKLPLADDKFKDTKQRPFKSLVNAFERALLHELIRNWVSQGIYKYDPRDEAISKERNLIDGCDFDTGVISLVNEIFEAFENNNPKLWLRQIKRSQELSDAVSTNRNNASYDYIFLIDRIDESWDGSDSAIISLMALMHACVRLSTSNPCIRPFIFIRENIYERIRKLDNEFSRLETSVVFLDWSDQKLVELAERRLIKPFATKPPLGEAWEYFFEDTATYNSKNEILSISQSRPRDLLMLISFALESAIGAGHVKITKEDVRAASERYSLSRLKDLGDEFSENYPNIGFILGFFFGLTTEFTLLTIEQIIQRLVSNKDVTKKCATWFFNYTTAQSFCELMYSIGFIGIRSGDRMNYRGAAQEAAFIPKIEQSSTLVIHPTYRNALSLRDALLPALSDDIVLKQSGILEDIPEGITSVEYANQLQRALESIDQIPLGDKGASMFEDLVGEVIKLCFFRSLTNLQAKCRSSDGRTIKDWVASNRAPDGFWEMIRIKHGATQIIWECKNYQELHADDFQQMAYYINDTVGKFGIIVFRGDEIKKSYIEHVGRISRDRNCVILILKPKDINVFIRQALNGKIKEGHIRDLYDKMVRDTC